MMFLNGRGWMSFGYSFIIRLVGVDGYDMIDLVVGRVFGGRLKLTVQQVMTRVPTGVYTIRERL